MNSSAALLLLLVVAPCVAQAAPPAAKGKDCFEYQDGCYPTAQEACQAVAKDRRSDPANDSPYGSVVGAKDLGDSFWCKLVDKNGNENAQSYGSKHSVKNDAPPAATPLGDQPTTPPPGCEADRSKGAAPRQNAVGKTPDLPDTSSADGDALIAEITRNNPDLVRKPTNTIPARTDKTVFRNEPLTPRQGPGDLDRLCGKVADQRGGGAEFTKKNARSKR